MGYKVVLCGPPHSGKSCLREGLKDVLRQIPGAPYPYVITACPDGEGAWFQATAAANHALAKELKEAYKAKFTPEFAHQAAGWVRNCALPLVLVDVGGRMSPENELIMAEATRANAAEAYIERIRTALGGYEDSDLASLAETLRQRNETLNGQRAACSSCDRPVNRLLDAVVCDRCYEEYLA